MKQGGLIIVSLALLFAFCLVPVAAQTRSVNFETYVVEDFDSPDTAEWAWAAVGSRFITEGYPLLKYFEGMPHALRVMQRNSDEKFQFLGMELKFNRKGNNWVDLFPTVQKDGETVPFEIPFKGRVSRVDVWVWGANYAYDLEMLVRDCNGIVHTVSFGMVNHQGWKNLAVNIPTNIQQVSPYLGGVQQMSFVAFRLRSRPMERVDRFNIFFDQLKALTDTYMESFDGFELVDASFKD